MFCYNTRVDFPRQLSCFLNKKISKYVQMGSGFEDLVTRSLPVKTDSDSDTWLKSYDILISLPMKLNAPRGGVFWVFTWALSFPFLWASAGISNLAPGCCLAASNREYAGLGPTQNRFTLCKFNFWLVIYCRIGTKTALPPEPLVGERQGDWFLFLFFLPCSLCFWCLTNQSVTRVSN